MVSFIDSDGKVILENVGYDIIQMVYVNSVLTIDDRQYVVSGIEHMFAEYRAGNISNRSTIVHCSRVA